MSGAVSECPATFYVDHGDYGESVDCSLPIEHNADDEPWHSGGWDGDGEEVIVRWRWDKDILVYRWPPPQDPFNKVWSTSYRHMAVLHGLDMTRLFTNVPTGEIPVTGTRVNWRKWEDLPKATVLEEPTEEP